MAESVDSVMREAPEIEAKKVALMEAAKAQADATNKAALEGRYLTPDYQVAGLNQDQTNAIQAGREGIGAYQPYMDAATDTMNAGVANLDLAGQTLQGADTRDQFAAGQAALNNAAGATSRMGASADLATQGIGMLDRGSADIDSAQAAMKASSQADLSTAQGQMNQGIGALYAGSNAGPSATATSQGYTTRDAGTKGYDATTYGGASAGPAERYGGDTVEAARLGAAPTVKAATGIAQLTDAAPKMREVGATAAQSNFNPNIVANEMGPAERVNTKSFTDQGTADSYMSPYMQNVVGTQQREAQRAADVATTGRRGEQTRSGAFGGSRAAIMDAEAARNLAIQKGDIQERGSQEAYKQAQQQFNAEQGYGIQAQTANQQAGLTVGTQNLAAKQGTQNLATSTAAATDLANLSARQAANMQTSSNAQQAAAADQSVEAQYGLTNTANKQAMEMSEMDNRQKAALADQAVAAQYGSQQGTFDQQAAMLSSSQKQAANLSNQAAANDMARFDAANTQSAEMQNAALKSRADEVTAGAENQAELANAAASNQQGALAAAAANQASIVNAGNENQMAQFNAKALQEAGSGQISAGNLMAGQEISQAGLGQAAASGSGALATQQGNLASQYANIAGQEANILSNQAAADTNIAQGIGSLATQQFGIGNAMAQGLGSLGTQQGNLATQTASLGGAEQAMGQSDVNLEFNLGAVQAQQTQAELDAARQNTLKKNMQPYEQTAFVSDIYKGAPSTQMASSVSTQAAASPFQQAAGLGIGALTGAAAVKKLF